MESSTSCTTSSTASAPTNWRSTPTILRITGASPYRSRAYASASPPLAAIISDRKSFPSSSAMGSRLDASLCHTADVRNFSAGDSESTCGGEHDEFHTHPARRLRRPGGRSDLRRHDGKDGHAAHDLQDGRLLVAC